MYVCSTTLKTLIVQSVLEVQGQIFVQSPIRVKSAKANCTKNNKKIHMQTAQTTSLEINFKNATCNEQLHKAYIEKFFMN